jgi:parvulin-like peptidyl-prolyl isomerase
LAKKRKVEKRPREYTRRQLSHFKKQQRRQRIFLFGGIAVIVAIILIILAGWLTGEYLPIHKTVIQVYDTKFDTAYYIDMLAIYGRLQASADLSQLAPYLPDQIVRTELLKQNAAKLGITVSDDEVKQWLESAGIPSNDAGMDFGRAILLPDKLKSGHFDSIVPTSDTQVHLKAIMVESESVAKVVREKIANSDNFTMLVEEYGQGSITKDNKGDFGLHPEAVFISKQVPAVAVEYAFSEEAKVGTVSPPLSDNSSYKQVGYWLIKVNDRPAEGSATVTALLMSNEDEAKTVRAKLVAGDNVAALASQYSQYTSAQDGELGIVSASDNTSDTPTYISAKFHEYVFDPSIELGEWSDPIRDDAMWTQGGYWIVQVVDRQEDSKLTDDDRTTLIDNAYNDWASDLITEAADNISKYFTSELEQWAIERATKKIQESSG